MAAPALSAQGRSVLGEYNAFWQAWPQFEEASGERRLVGFEVELIGYHDSELAHVDPACPICHRVRSVLLGIADRMLQEGSLNQASAIWNIDSHSNSVLCLPALGNRSAVSVSLNLFWGRTTKQTFETDLLSKVRLLLSKYGIHQR